MATEPTTESPKTLTTALENLDLNSTLEATKANDMSTSHVCAVCNISARLCCNGCCVNALSVDDYQEKTWYCGKDCQKLDWQRHKAHSKPISTRLDAQALARTAKLLHSLFMSYRHVAYDLSIAAVEREGDTLHVKEGEYDLDHNLIPGYDAVQSHLQLDPDDHTILLTMMSCTDALTYLYDCCALLLRDTDLVREIKEITMRNKIGPRRWVMLRPWGTETSEEYQHEIYLITLKGGSKWAMDLAGGQFGNKEVLKPWGEYVQERVSNIHDVHDFGTKLRNTYRHYAPAEQSGSLELDTANPDEVARAIKWSAYLISRSLHENIQKILKNEDMSAKDFLRTISDDRYDALSHRIETDARNAMQISKKQAAAKIIHR